MKITIATGLYPPEIGGPATYTVLLEKELPKKGYEVEVVPFSWSRHLPKILRHLHFFFLILKQAKDSDLFFAQDVASVGLPTILAAKLTGTTFFVRVPGDYAWEQASQRYGVTDSIDEFQTKKYGLRVQFLRKIQTFVTKHADAVVTPSDYFNRLVTTWGVAGRKVHTIYNGVDLSMSPSAVEKPSSLTLVTAGRLVPWKGFSSVIKLMERLPTWNLVILGDGPEKQNLIDLVKELSLDHRVYLKGSVSREDVFGWCRTSDAFILNTHFESFSYQIVEAMYSGKPVITTNVGSIPELIQSGEEGLLFECDDLIGMESAVKSVLMDRDIWARRTKAAKAKAEKFSIQSTMDALDELISKTKK